MYSKDCIFCKLANGEIPTQIVYEDEKVFAFNDMNPQAPVHILVIPKAHYVSLNELDDNELMGDLLNAVRKITQKLDIREYRTVLNTGKAAGQEVFHIHFHILAGRDMKWPPG